MKKYLKYNRSAVSQIVIKTHAYTVVVFIHNYGKVIDCGANVLTKPLFVKLYQLYVKGDGKKGHYFRVDEHLKSTLLALKEEGECQSEKVFTAVKKCSVSNSLETDHRLLD